MKEGGEIFIRLRKNENGKYLYQCPFNQECGAIRGQNVYYHAQRHRDERQFQCNVCAATLRGGNRAERAKIKIWRFNTLKDLVQHQRAKHKPPVQCVVCGKYYSRGDSLKRHLRTLHADRNNNNNNNNNNNADDETKADSNHCVDGDTTNNNDTGREMMDIDDTNDDNTNNNNGGASDCDEEEQEESDCVDAQYSDSEENDDDDDDFVLPAVICRRKKYSTSTTTTTTEEEEEAVENRRKKQSTSTSTTTYRYSKMRSRRRSKSKKKHSNDEIIGRELRRSCRLQDKQYKEFSKISYKSAGYMDLISDKTVNNGDVIKFRRNTSEQYQYGQIMFRKKRKGLIYETRALMNDKTEKRIEVNLDKCDWFECDGETSAKIKQQLKDND